MDAISFARKRISCLEKMPANDDVEKKIVGARTVLGLYYTQMSLPVEAKAIVDPVVDLAIKHNHKRRVSQINTILGFYYGYTKEDYPRAVEHFEKALKIGEELNDFLTIVLANTYLGVCLSDHGEFEKALLCFEKALDINVMANVLWGIAALKANIVICVYCRQGKFELAHQTSQEALRIAEESGDIYSKGHAHLACGLSYYLNNDLEKAEEHLSKSLNFCQKIKYLSFAAASSSYLAAIYLEMTDYERSQEYYTRSTSFWGLAKNGPSYIIMNKISGVLLKVMNKDKDINLNEIFKWHEDIKIKWVKGLMPNLIGKILLIIDDQHISEAGDWIKKAIETNQKYGMKWNLAQDYALYAELFKRKGDLLKAKEKLTKSIEIFKECGVDGWVERYKKELALIS